MRNPLDKTMKRIQGNGIKVKGRFGKSFGRPRFNSGGNPISGFRGFRNPLGQYQGR